MRPRPLLHPIALVAIAVLLANDHWWKTAWPSFGTVKLSDFAGLTFFPVLLALGLEALRVPGRRALLVSVLSTALVFTLVKCWPSATELYRHGLGLLQSGRWQPVAAVTDPTDLIALPCAAFALLLRTPAPAPQWPERAPGLAFQMRSVSRKPMTANGSMNSGQ